MEDPDVSVTPGDDPLKARITTGRKNIGIRLEQPWRDYEARVCAVVYDEYYDLTFGEAGELAEVLAGLVREAAEDGEQ